MTDRATYQRLNDEMMNDARKPGPGHNRPPTLAEQLAIDHADLKDRADQYASEASVAKVTSELEAQAYTAAASAIKAVLDEADKAHKIAKQPWLDGSRTVDNFFAFRATLTAAAARLRNTISKWQTEQRNAALKAKAEEERKLREMAEAFDMPEPLPPAREGPPVGAPMIRAASGAKASGSVKWEHRVTNPALLDRQYLMPNPAAIAAAVAGLKAQGIKVDDAKIAGVEIVEVVRASIR